MITSVQEQIAPIQAQLLNHPLYERINHPEHLRIFMEHHVFAVWDFMSLLKALQQGLTCPEVPWKPVGNPNTRYLINEIVLAEETDSNAKGERLSHYEMYLDAMNAARANTNTIQKFVEEMAHSKNWTSAITAANIPPSVREFLLFTFQTIEQGKLHEIAAAFTFGREDLIPDMFSAIIEKIQGKFPKTDLTELQYYFDRHIELDGDEHGPMALEMVTHLCDTTQKWNDVVVTSIKALEARKKLWDGILEAIENEAMG